MLLALVVSVIVIVVDGLKYKMRWFLGFKLDDLVSVVIVGLLVFQLDYFGSLADCWIWLFKHGLIGLFIIYFKIDLTAYEIDFKAKMRIRVHPIKGFLVL